MVTVRVWTGPGVVGTTSDCTASVIGPSDRALGSWIEKFPVALEVVVASATDEAAGRRVGTVERDRGQGVGHPDEVRQAGGGQVVPLDARVVGRVERQGRLQCGGAAVDDDRARALEVLDVAGQVGLRDRVDIFAVGDRAVAGVVVGDRRIAPRGPRGQRVDQDRRADRPGRRVDQRPVELDPGVGLDGRDVEQRRVACRVVVVRQEHAVLLER